MLWCSQPPQRIYNLRHVKVSKQGSAAESIFEVCVKNDLSERDDGKNFVESGQEVLSSTTRTSEGIQSFLVFSRDHRDKMMRYFHSRI